MSPSAIKHENKQLKIFGLIWSAIFALIAFYPILKNDGAVRLIPLYICLFFFIVSVTYPKIYKIIYFYQGWIKFGNFIGKINSKLIIIILFYGMFLPIALILRVFGKDLLSKKLDKSADSYFINRESQPHDMKNQF